MFDKIICLKSFRNFKNYSNIKNPKSGFINALDYKSPKGLSDYLIYLDNNKTAYNEYFRWKKHVNFIDNLVSYGFICEMCIHLHLEDYFGIKKKVIERFDFYWNQERQCKVPKLSF